MSSGITRSNITLHVGLGTFRPVSAETINDHEMHYERYEVPENAASQISNARSNGGRVVAVGSTSVRTLESLPEIGKAEGSTNIFIYPPYEFKHVDAILTNFHLPDSTPCLLVAALLPPGAMRRAYEHALAGPYRFYSYGDAMLVI